MTTPDGLPPLRDVIARYGLSARKSLGQNFILDLNLTRRIAREAGDISGATIIEVGPGPGGLTRALLMEGAAHVIAIERDERCLPALAEISQRYPGRLQVIEADALTIDYAQIVKGSDNVHVVANLPYGIATQLLATWLTTSLWPPWYRSLVLMFQKEVAERLTAPPGSRSYGRLSVLAQWRTTPRIALTLPPQAFTPPPKVESAVVKLLPRPSPLDAGSLQALERVTAAAFGQRRKMLRASLKSLVPDPVDLLERTRIDPRRRAETLTVADFCALARAYNQRMEACRAQEPSSSS
ncbi:MAG: 16S rRNA (adenine(1518)-N(6)/adenine(1519)-N(6))-dimethyltransferase RsmA [Alphaproteobacteria bacterium]|nr:MAG: 16S rRNA (adenine(1518)-N(6)/adenine(1519)-N(6))-dimethyltransferase RsmA [Alphaproteobacteria bacterium]